ncbi:MAG: cytochrome c3 family protein [Planctomycetota bacterium]
MASATGGRAAQRSLADKLRSGPGATNHPVGVRPSGMVRVPDGWPVADDGSITCLTCHRQLPPLEGAAQAYLRDFFEEDAEPLEFCRKCHSDDTGRSAAALHWLAVGEAHVDDEATGSRRSGGPLDPESRRCMGCHDGVNAVEAQNTTGGGRGVGDLGDRSRNHPVGVRYPEHTTRNRTVPLRPMSLLPNEIRLPDGKVSCVSCHDLYATDRDRLTVPIERSALCFSCHEMD